MENNSTIKYMPQLDTLRAFAVIGVLISHWLGVHMLGGMGVTLFFVLSGFLITGILLRARGISESRNESKFTAIKQFYTRRTLRIFPIYYITLFVFMVAGLEFAREYAAWYLTYTTNFLLYFKQEWIGYFSHLWTLAVEEQFYIVWPFVILFIPGKYLLRSVIAIIFIAPLFRIVMYLIQGNIDNSFQDLLTPSNMDCFGMGALLAYCRLKNISLLDFKTTVSKVFVLLVFLFMMSIIFFYNSNPSDHSLKVNIISQTTFRTVLTFLCLFLISKASTGFTGILKPLFENKALMYIGKISYGIYLFHPFCIVIYEAAGFTFSKNIYFNFVILFIEVIIVSSISWFIIEKPINNLKRYFTYN